jgi:hypothetical protein
MLSGRFTLSFIPRALFVALGLLAAAACSGNSSSPPSNIPPTIAPGAPGPSPTATAIPNSVATSVPLSIATSGPAVSTPLPAPSGYTSHITIPIVNAAPGTTFQFNSSATLPTQLPILQSKSRASSSVRIPQAAGNFLPIYFTSIVPSAAVTLAGDISITQTLPTGVLSTANTYYLAFYDSTQATPSWQTIQGPVTTTDGRTLTFGGDIKSFTLQANQLYGFAIFSLASSTVTPPPAPQTLAYIANEVGGIDEYTETGTKLATLPISATSFGMDDSGNIYAVVQPTSPASSPTPLPIVEKFAAGSVTPSATYVPTSDSVGSPVYFLAGVSGAGASSLLYVSANTNGPSVDVWNPGIVGSPSFFINEVAGSAFNSTMAHDGTIYIQNVTAAGLSQISVYAPGSSTPTRTIPEQIVPTAQQSQFVANYGAVGPDGTFYLTEYSFFPPDPLVGLYIYHPDGTESFVKTSGTTGGTPGSLTGNGGVDGVDVDAAGNIYVAANNEGFDPNTLAPIEDTLNDIEVFAPGGVSVLRHITGTTSPVTLVVASDGTLFVSGFGVSPGDPAGTWVAQAGATTVTKLNSNATGSIFLYDGVRATSGVARTLSLGSGGSHGISSNMKARLAAILAARRRH